MSKYIILNSTYNFPEGFSAANTKFRYFAKGIINKYSCYIVEGIDNSSDCSVIRRDGVICIKYNYNGFLLKILAPLFILMKIYKSSNKTDLVILTSSPKFRLLFSLLLFKSINKKVKIGYVFHEWHAATNISLPAKFKCFIYDNFAGYFYNFILPISSFLEKKSLKFHKTIIKLPILFHYDNCPSQKEILSQSSFITYCGQIDYFRVIKIIIEVAELLNQMKEKVYFNLVLYGNQKNIENLQTMINKKKLNHTIKIFQNIPDSKLHFMYRESLALLIPLSKHSIQDIARFSQKIAEYISSGRPIITNNVGDIELYFRDKESAIILDDLTSMSLYNGISLLKKNKMLANRIGENGFLVGKEYFDYLKVSTNIINKISRL